MLGITKWGFFPFSGLLLFVLLQKENQLACEWCILSDFIYVSSIYWLSYLGTVDQNQQRRRYHQKAIKDKRPYISVLRAVSKLPSVCSGYDVKMVDILNMWLAAGLYVRQLASSLPSLQSGSPSHLHFLWIHSPERHCISLDKHLAGGVGWRPQRVGDSSDWS